MNRNRQWLFLVKTFLNMVRPAIPGILGSWFWCFKALGNPSTVLVKSNSLSNINSYIFTPVAIAKS